MVWFSASLGPKGQITLPKKVREALHLREKGDLVGFLWDEKSREVRLSRMEVHPAEEDYTEAELKKLVKLSKQQGAKKFNSAQEFLRHIEKL